MRTLLFAALFVTGCLRGTGTDPDAASNGNGNPGNGNNPADASTTNGSNGNPTPDAGNGSNGNPTPDAGMAGPPCINKQASPGSGHHNAGQDCNGACHDHGFTLAGTLYTTPTGFTAITGATIVAKDAGGHTIQMVSMDDGNFYTTTPVQFPVTVYATECQISQTASQMSATVLSSSNGGCNKSGCHTTSAQGHVHLP
jgi:hypothetical protein